MSLLILRAAFVLLATCVAVLYVLLVQQSAADEAAAGAWDTTYFAQSMGVAFAIVLGVILADVLLREKRLGALAGIFLGLIAGAVVAYPLWLVVDLVGLLAFADQQAEYVGSLLQGIKVFVGVICIFTAISLVIQTKDDFRFVIPYVEFAKEIRGNRPTILDTSVIIDGRVLDIVQTHVIQGTLIIPRFVLQELQHIADSADRLRRERGRRGLDVLQKLQDGHLVEVHIDETDPPGSSVDQKLLALAERQPG